MIIDLANVGNEAETIELVFEPDEIDFDGDNISLTDKTLLHAELERDGNKAIVRGTINADATFDCTRCLTPIRRNLEIPFRAVFIDSSEEDSKAESEVSDDQLDESLVLDGRIDMAEVVREQILLSVPEQIYCFEECRGLCPKCGSNLNLIDCKCADDEMDPRWAALKNLK